MVGRVDHGQGWKNPYFLLIGNVKRTKKLSRILLEYVILIKSCREGKVALQLIAKNNQRKRKAEWICKYLLRAEKPLKRRFYGQFETPETRNRATRK